VRYCGLLAIAALFGCAQHNVMIRRESGASLSNYHRIGVMPFKDKRGKGFEIAQTIDQGLQKLTIDTADVTVLRRLAEKYKVDSRADLSLEPQETIRTQTSADALIMGTLSPDWSVVSFELVDLEMADPVIRVVIKPHDKKKAFESAAEVSADTLQVLAGLR
jgi:hypothetical protein